MGTSVYNLSDLNDYLLQRLRQTLPGVTSHEPLKAIPVGKVRPAFTHVDNPRPGGVLILLYEDGGSIKFPLIKRPDYPGAHGGQISLPGGKTELGESATETALREAEEEIGIKRADVEILGQLSNFMVIPSNFLVTPVVATMMVKPVFHPDAYEVEQVIEGDIYDLIQDNAVQQKEILVSGRYTMLAPHFEIQGHIVWGATAMMLNELRTIIREIIRH
jgi:8-oxo-dGTP pyrophosphatase MutT (NUDIX family)